MDVVFDEIKGSVVDQPPDTSAERAAGPMAAPAAGDHKLGDELMRIRARRRRLQAD